MSNAARPPPRRSEKPSASPASRFNDKRPRPRSRLTGPKNSEPPKSASPASNGRDATSEPAGAATPTTAQGEAARNLNTALNRRREAERFAEAADSRRTRRHWRHDAKEWADREVKAQRTYDDVVVPEETRLDHQIDETGDRVQELRQLQEDRSSWLREHPEATARLQGIDRELNPLQRHARDPPRAQPTARPTPRTGTPSRDGARPRPRDRHRPLRRLRRARISPAGRPESTMGFVQIRFAAM